MRMPTVPLAAVVALGLGLATACSSPRPTASGAGPATSSPSVGVSTSTQPPATSNPPGSAPPATANIPGYSRPDPYAEAAEHFHLREDTVRNALTDTRIEMVRIGGDAGQNLHGVDPQPIPIDQGAHLDPRVITFFAGRLGVSESQAHAVMTFLLDEWNEYDKRAAQNNQENNTPGFDAIASRLATGLGITKARAIWYESLLIGRPSPGDRPDRLEQAVTDALGVTSAQFQQALAK